MKRINSQSQYVVNYEGIDSVKENLEELAQILKQHGLLCFRNAHLNDAQATDLLKEVSSHFHWSPVYVKANGELSNWKYTQHYDERVGEDKEFKPVESAQKLVNPWHLEGMYKKNSQHAAGWNMRHFKCSSSVGQTGFVDASELLEKLPSQMYEFLKAARLIHYPIFVNKRPDPANTMTEHFAHMMNDMHEQIWSVDGHMEIASNAHNAIERHPSLGYEVLRLCPCVEQWGNQHLLFSVGGEKPTEKDIAQFAEIQRWLSSELENRENAWFHEWHEGDFLIPDLFIMIHAARAGFSAGEREFDGFWCFESGIDYSDESLIFRKHK